MIEIFAFAKLRDRYVKAKRDLKKKSRSGTSSSAVNKIKEKLESLKYLSWQDSYVKTRPSKPNLGENLSDDDNLFAEIDNQENQSSSNVSLASVETNRNKSNQNSRKINHRKPGGKTTNGKKRNNEKRSYEKGTENEN